MSTALRYKGYVVHADSFSLAIGIWDSFYWIEVHWSGQYVHEVAHAATRKTSNGACNAAMALGLQYIDLTLPDAGS